VVTGTVVVGPRETTVLVVGSGTVVVGSGTVVVVTGTVVVVTGTVVVVTGTVVVVTGTVVVVTGTVVVVTGTVVVVTGTVVVVVVGTVVVVVVVPSQRWDKTNFGDPPETAGVTSADDPIFTIDAWVYPSGTRTKTLSDCDPLGMMPAPLNVVLALLRSNVIDTNAYVPLFGVRTKCQ